jgi:stalled ribosome rescue protein Dom34
MIRASEVVFILTREDVIGVAKEMGIPEEAITDDVFYKVKKGVESAWEGWPEVVKAAISYALKD